MKNDKKLKLNSQTLRRLTDADLRDVAGGLVRAAAETETCDTCGSCTSECNLRFKV
jgi:hypothetical protein